MLRRRAKRAWKAAPLVAAGTPLAQVGVGNPCDVDSGKATATLENGMLIITLPKAALDRLLRLVEAAGLEAAIRIRRAA